MKTLDYLFPLLAVSLLAGCASQIPPRATQSAIADAVQEARRSEPRIQPPAPAPTVPEVPAPRKAPEKRFDLAFSGAPAAQVFAALGSGSPYNLLVHPEVEGTISAHLKDVTLFEALDALRELYGYDYRVQGRRVTVLPANLQARVFQINYLAGRRQGQTDVRVTSGSISSLPANSAPGTANASTNTNTATNPVAGGVQRAPDSSRIQTSSDQDFWADVARALETLVGKEAGRSVVVNGASGVILVRAMPTELQQVEHYLKTTQLVVERQVMLEAKIIEVELSEGFQAGINWANLQNGSGVGVNGQMVTTDGVPSGTTLRDLLGGGLTAASGRTDGGVFGLAVRSGNFGALLQFLETQGQVQVLSSPRIATLNNQKAVLKVGTDEFFVTNVTTTTNSSSATTTTSPTITTAPFFSGIALDVTPQIDQEGNIILHVHPSISSVTEKTKSINLGQLGSITLPLAASTVNETDSIVRVRDGQIVAIGGLMKQSQSDTRSAVPGGADVPVLGYLLGQRAKSFSKRELVILLRPTVIRDGADWRRESDAVEQRLPTYVAPERDLWRP